MAGLKRGPGIERINIKPVERWGDADAARAYWGIGLHLGRPGAQNSDDELLGHVVDTGGPTLPRARRALHVASGTAFKRSEVRHAIVRFPMELFRVDDPCHSRGGDSAG